MKHNESYSDSDSESDNDSDKLRLLNYSQNICYTNSAVQFLSLTEIKRFLVFDLPCNPSQAISTAQELARLYKKKGEDSTDQLRR